MARRDVIDTFIDALAFFVPADPSIAAWDSPAELKGLPLSELPGPIGEYQRRTPFTKSLRDWRAELFDYAKNQAPGNPRAITGVVVDDDGTIECYVGTTEDGPFRGSFIETPDQIDRDVANGAHYHVAGTVLSSGVGGPEVGGDALHTVSLPELSPGEAEATRWRLQLRTDDPDLYIRRRKS